MNVRDPALTDVTRKVENKVFKTWTCLTSKWLLDDIYYAFFKWYTLYV
jgi:hypothetical protein